MTSTLDLRDLVLIAFIAFVIGCLVVGWIASAIGQRREDFWTRKYYGVIQDSFKVEEENRRLSSHFDARVEKEVAARISSWQPDPTDAEADFRKAEYMARLREQLNAGRSHPPRADGGDPAVVHRMTFRR